MNLPLFMNDTFGYQTGLVLVVAIGFLFGFVLERSGFGRASVLTAQFYFTDMRVLKVMFSAIVTALLGLVVLGGFGLVDLAQIEVPPSHLWPMVVGGLVLGVGFVTCGYCPGTAVVGTASGNLDALVSLGGILLGTAAFGWAYPLLEGFYNGSPLDQVLLQDTLGLPHAALGAAVLAMAVGAFLGAEKLEQIFARRGGQQPPPGSPGLRNRIFFGLGLVAVVGLATLAFEPARAAAGPSKPIATIEPLALARKLVAEPERVVLVDLRDAAACAKQTIPGAMCLPAEGVSADFFAGLGAARTLVVFADGDLAERPPGAPPAPIASFPGSVAAVRGGFAGFAAAVLTAPRPPEQPTAASLEEYRLRAALHAHFTGVKVEHKPIEIKAVSGTREIKKGGGC